MNVEARPKRKTDKQNETKKEATMNQSENKRCPEREETNGGTNSKGGFKGVKLDKGKLSLQQESRRTQGHKKGTANQVVV